MSGSTATSVGCLRPVVEMRGGGGSGGVKPPPKCARKCANFRNLKANVQILDRNTPPQNGLPYFAYCLRHSMRAHDGAASVYDHG